VAGCAPRVLGGGGGVGPSPMYGLFASPQLFRGFFAVFVAVVGGEFLCTLRTCFCSRWSSLFLADVDGLGYRIYPFAIA